MQEIGKPVMTKDFSETKTPPPTVQKLETFLQQIAPRIVI